MPSLRSAAVRGLPLLALAATLVSPAAAQARPTWTTSGPQGGPSFEIAVDPGDGLTAYAATFGGIYKTVDGGSHWSGASVGLRSHLVWDLAIDHATPQHLFALAGSSFYRSLDGAAHWTSIAGMPRSISSVAAAGGSVYAITPDGEVLTSADDGAHWLSRPRLRLTYESQAEAVAVDPSRPSHAVVVADDGIYTTLDGGATFRRTLQPRRSWFMAAAYDPARPNVVYATRAFPGTLYRSADGGIHWTAAPAHVGQWADMVAAAGGDVYVGAETGLLRSTDGGAHWTRTGSIPHGLAGNALGASDEAPSRLYLPAVGGVAVSADAGAHWHVGAAGIFAFVTSGLAVDRRDPRRAYTIGFAGTIHRTSDGGASWRRGGRHLRASSIDADPDRTGRVYAVTNGRLAISHDGGARWHVRPRVSRATVLATIHAGRHGRLYATAYSLRTWQDVLVRSADRGAHWGRCARPRGDVGLLVPSPRRSRVVWSLTTDGLYRSGDGCRRWRRSLRTSSGSAFAISPSATRVAYLATASGLRRTRDGGATWQRLQGPGGQVTSIAVGPTGVVYVSVLHPRLLATTVEASFDGGRHWFDAQHDLPPTALVLGLAAGGDPAPAVYAGTFGDGVWTLRP